MPVTMQLWGGLLPKRTVDEVFAGHGEGIFAAEHADPAAYDSSSVLKALDVSLRDFPCIKRC